MASGVKADLTRIKPGSSVFDPAIIKTYGKEVKNSTINGFEQKKLAIRALAIKNSKSDVTKKINEIIESKRKEFLKILNE